MAEGLGTFVMVFCGTGAIIINDLSNNMIGHLGISITFGMIVMVMIYSIGNISGAHINPAVSIAFSLIKKLSLNDLFCYVSAQIIGAIGASLLLNGLFQHPSLGTTMPSDTIIQSFILESFLTFILMFVIISVSEDQELKKFTGIAVGATVLLEALFAGPISGASMNPARSLGPAIVSGELNCLWIYITAPVIGSCLAVICWKFLNSKKTQ